MTESQLRERYPNASEAFIRLNAGASVSPGAIPPTLAPAGAKRLRQRTEPKLNKTEAAFMQWLQERHDAGTIRAQSVTFVLANGVRYTPDFTNLRLGLAWETKGFMRDDAAVKIKVAAAMYPEIRFHLVTRKGGTWEIQEMLP